VSKVDDNYRPPTSTEFSIWYRRAYSNGGSWKIAFASRSFHDLFDYFPGDVFQYTNPNTGAVSNQIRQTLKNTDEFERTYSGVELSWDIPITSRISFGGSYTYSKLMSNQANTGSGQTYAMDGSDILRLQTPEHWDEVFAEKGGRSYWAPMIKLDAEFSMRYYLIVNLTQGKARSNFTLNGSWGGSSFNFDNVRYRMGAQLFQPVINYPGAAAVNSTGIDEYRVINVNKYTTAYNYPTHSLIYNLTMPLVRKLSWFMSINVNDVFNHRFKNFSAGQGSGNHYTNYANTVTPPGIQSSATGYLTASNPLEQYINQYSPAGWLSTDNIGTSYYGRGGGRSFNLSTGLRF
jgi:hypothetical protein